MKNKVLTIAMMIFLLPGCGTVFYCPINLPARIKFSMRDYWIFSENEKKLKEEKIQDWTQCGGKEDGWYQTPVLWSESTTTEEIITASRQKVAEIERCMLDKGYRYVGKCDSEITRNSVACREGRQ